MTEIASLAALPGLIALAIAVYWLLRPGARIAWLAAASIGLVAAYDLAAAATVVATLVVVHAGGRLLAVGPRESRRRKLVALLALLIGALTLLKSGSSLVAKWSAAPPGAGGDISAGLLPLGFSFVVFRSIHVLVEVYRGRFAAPGFLELAAYLLFFPAFLAGPLERFPRFLQQSREPAPLRADDVAAALGRILRGAFRKVVIADLLAMHVRSVLGWPENHSGGEILLAIYGAAVWLYMDFGGYSDMAIGVGRLLGYRLPENFDRPLLAGSIAAFWRRWHMSLYAFIRDYVFLPLFGRHPTPVKTAVGVIFTMTVFMVWHGAELRWVVLGLYHGSALVLWSLVQDLKAGRPRLRRALASRPGAVASWLLTQHVVAFGFLFFFFDVSRAAAIVGRLV